MTKHKEGFIGIDVAKTRNAIAIAAAGREGEVRFFGEVDATPTGMRRAINRIAANFERLHFCYEAGPTGYGLYRQIRSLGHDCMVVAPSLIPRKASDRVKTNRRDAISLARLLRAGELTAVWVPDEGHEAMRDLVRARTAAVEALRMHRQQVSAFMLKHGRIYLAMGGQIVDATVVAAPKQRNTDDEKADIKAGKIPDAWKDKPAKLRQKDRDARWTVKFSKAKVDDEGKQHKRDIAVPVFGYKNHAAIDQRHRFIRGWTVTNAAAYDGAQLRNVVKRPNTGSTVWADTAYRSKKNEAWLDKNGFVSDIHQKKPKGRSMSEAMARANGRRSKIRSRIEHVFAHQKAQDGPVCQNHRHRQSDDEDRHGQSRLQHHPIRLARKNSSIGMTRD